MNKEQQEAAAKDFLTLIVSSKIDEAYEKYVDFSGKHHNIFTEAGFDALKKGMKDNDSKFPDKKLIIKNVISDGDMTVLHSHLIMKPGEMEMMVVHMLKFKDGKIVEMWDCAQPIEDNNINSDGAF
jgi:predicted SnoaL-like aldol condensation-catalyzing enzyme